MIDTLVLSIEGLDFTVAGPGYFGPPQGLPHGGWRRSQNATAKEKARNVTKPALTWYGGGPLGCRTRLRMEFSAPKLFYGNNLEELADAEGGDLVKKLQEALSSMGVEVEEEALWRAGVSKLHVAKNVRLDPGMTCPEAIRELGTHVKNANWDITRSHFLNEGMAVKYHTNTREVAFYDKLADIARAQRSPKRATDRLSGGLGIPLCLGKKAQVLRMECRFNTPAAVKAALKKVGILTSHPVLLDVFSEEVAMRLLMDEIKMSQGSAGGTPRPGETGLDLLSRNLGKGMKLQASIKAVGLHVLEKEGGLTGIRTVLTSHGVPREAIYRLKVPGSSGGGTGGTVLQVLREAIETYTPFRLDLREGVV